ncbi:Na+-transporting oxaloacetate decarboxylase subunit gamma [Sulfurovum lithotrophicum]|uniref:Probable oxaloacetate decarboxylase gamma chain n=1 Tax=Sulfurovum lithotrophicum TaxID=206403 RepID=A0A7U4M1D6_9BACT|nr:OadG family protein [Sulfurovum lithotrophicum]AKF25081.1 Na+-transporting oxaloacetate decarboxylase subunit gamma [Sulfurovum lithotrophicum]
MEVNLVSEGLKFMVLGMLIVFIFLIVLVQVMKLQAKIINKYFPEKEPAVPMPSTQDSSDEDARRTAAIIAAVTEFRKK